MNINIDKWNANDKNRVDAFLKWNGYLSQRHKLFYIATPKVACTTIKWWFASLEGCADKIRESFVESSETDPELLIHDVFFRVAPHVTGLPLLKYAEAFGSDDYFTFALVRNPYKRIFSAWESKLLLQEPLQATPYLECPFYHLPINTAADIRDAFECFLEHLAENESPAYWDYHWTPQKDLLRPDLIPYSKLAKIEECETLNQELKTWLRPDIPGPFDGRRTNESLIPYLSELVTERSVELIRTLYAQDFETFGYDTCPPRSKTVFNENHYGIIIKAIKLIRARHQRFAERSREISGLKQEVEERDRRISGLNLQLHQILNSNSWKLMKPMRNLRHLLTRKNGVTLRSTFSFVAHKAWTSLPFSIAKKQQLKKLIFITTPPIFKHTSVYQNWLKTQQIMQWNVGNRLERSENEYIPLTNCESPINNPVKLICFYLPQFHPIPENDKWWGKGFTEWTNVQPATAQFEGHYQPRIPGELGYYDLLDPGVQKRQVELAKLYGIGGFCFYFYWFAGKRLLETPIENYLQDSSLDLPFCLCWANENWSRRWDGLDNQILITQQHSPEDDLAFIKHVARYMRDERYIRIDGKPLLLVYRPNLLPSASKTAARWRQWCKKNGIGEIYLAYTQSFETVDPSTYGFDAAIEFPPNNSAPPIITDSVTPLNDDFDCTVYDWRIFVERSKNYQKPAYTLFRGVCPSWDNTARRKNTSGIFINNTPELYQNWLENAINDTLENQTNPDKRLIFVNAWNEWAEGAYLEPDAHYGYAWLQATRNALEAKIAEGRRKVMLVTHDCHPHGAQFLALEIARELVRNGFLPAIVALDGGRLLDEFAQIGPMIVASSSRQGALCNFLTDCRNQGYSSAITSTVVCGSIVPELKRHGFQVLSLIHELSGVIHEMKQESNAKYIAELSDRIVFPAKLVRDHYTTITPLSAEKTFIRPQGLLRKNPYQGKNREAHREVCQRHGFPINTRIVLSIGFLDHRKGADLFVKIAAQVCQNFKDIVFIWVGHTEPNMERHVREKIKDFNLQDRILLIGFDPEPLVYYAAASVYALTSREDPFPNVVLESASVGVPIVAFENTTGAAGFIVKQGGLLARHLDVTHFATHIGNLLADQTELLSHLSIDLSLRRYVLDLLHYLTGSARISVIVPNYNYARYIKRRLDSIRMQTYPIYELIILDDASTDESVSRITDYCRENDCDARVVLNKDNSGSVFSQWEKGIRMATGDLVWIAEADDSSNPNFLSTLVPAFAEKEIVLACCQSRQINEKGRVLANDYLSYTNGVSTRWQNDHFSMGVDTIRESLCIKNVIPNVSGVLFDRKALVQAIENIGEDLYDYRVAADWLVYLHVLVQGRFFFSSKSLNDHCRHTKSVTCDAVVGKHLDEVAKLQTIAQKIAQPDKSVIAQAHEYLEQLRVQFGLDKIQHQKGT